MVVIPDTSWRIWWNKVCNRMFKLFGCPFHANWKTICIGVRIWSLGILDSFAAQDFTKGPSSIANVDLHFAYLVPEDKLEAGLFSVIFLSYTKLMTKQLSQFGHNARKYKLMNAVRLSLILIQTWDKWPTRLSKNTGWRLYKVWTCVLVQ